MTKYTDKDAARDTKSSSKEVSRAHHQARTDAHNDPKVNFKRGGSNKGSLFKKSGKKK